MDEVLKAKWSEVELPVRRASAMIGDKYMEITEWAGGNFYIDIDGEETYNPNIDTMNVAKVFAEDKATRGQWLFKEGDSDE